jgi:bromodomain-containing factor 1
MKRMKESAIQKPEEEVLKRRSPPRNPESVPESSAPSAETAEASLPGDAMVRISPQQQSCSQYPKDHHLTSDTKAKVTDGQSSDLSQRPHIFPSADLPVVGNIGSEPSLVPPVQEQAQVDRDMPDAPLLSAKIPRERDEDPSEEPAAKRPKTDDAAQSTPPEFKVPDLPSTPGADGPAQTSSITKLQQKFLIRCFGAMRRLHDSRFFREPVDSVKLNIPSYPLIIKNPMDMHTIEDGLKAGHYVSVDAVVSDFNLIIENAVTFNGPDHVVTIEGQRLKEHFDRHLSKLPKPDEVEPTAAEKKAKKSISAPTKTQPARRESRTARPATATSPTTFALGPEGLPLIRRDSSTADGRPKRSIHPPKNRDLPYSAKPKKKKYQWELKFCQDVLDELHKPKHYNIAAPFYHPVDPVALNIPNYHNIIKKPMDLQTVQTKLQTGQYENAKEMEIDVRQIFKNCFKFNIPGDPTYTAGKKLEELFDNKWSQKARWIEAHEPSSGHQSGGTSDNESDDNEEDSDDDNDQEKLSLLQKQIAEMSKQVEAITQKKKKTPPGAAKKAGKSKPGKKDPKKGSGTTGGSSAKKDKKSGSKSSKPEKQRWVTYREKQIISHGISSLPDKRMSEALKIIQANVPSIKVISRSNCVFFPGAKPRRIR